MPDTPREPYDVHIGLNRKLGAELKIAPETGQTAVAVVEHTLPPATLAAPLHRHRHEDELSYILEGQMGIQEGEAVSTIAAGEATVKERGLWHTFWNPGPDRLRFLEIIAPGDFAWYFAEADSILPAEGEPDADAAAELAALHEQYGFEMRPESVPRLRERHGLDGR